MATAFVPFIPPHPLEHPLISIFHGREVVIPLCTPDGKVDEDNDIVIDTVCKCQTDRSNGGRTVTMDVVLQRRQWRWINDYGMQVGPCGSASADHTPTVVESLKLMTVYDELGLQATLMYILRHVIEMATSLGRHARITDRRMIDALAPSDMEKLRDWITADNKNRAQIQRDAVLRRIAKAEAEFAAALESLKVIGALGVDVPELVPDTQSTDNMLETICGAVRL